MVKKFRIISITFLLVDKRFSENFSQFSGRDSLEVFFVFFVGNVNDKSRRSYRTDSRGSVFAGRRPALLYRQ